MFCVTLWFCCTYEQTDRVTNDVTEVCSHLQLDMISSFVEIGETDEYSCIIIR